MFETAEAFEGVYELPPAKPGGYAGGGVLEPIDIPWGEPDPFTPGPVPAWEDTMREVSRGVSYYDPMAGTRTFVGGAEEPFGAFPEEEEPGYMTAGAGGGSPWGAALAVGAGLAAEWAMDKLFGGETGGEVPSAPSGTTIGGTTMANGTSLATVPVVGGIPLVGPGVPEPVAGSVTNRWSTKYQTKDGNWHKLEFYHLINGYIVCWNSRTGGFKYWKPKKPYIMGRDPGVSSLTRMGNVVARKLEGHKKVIKRLKKVVK